MLIELLNGIACTYFILSILKNFFDLLNFYPLRWISLKHSFNQISDFLIIDFLQ